MRSVFDAATPSADVLSGKLRDEVFAAQLEEVVAGRGERVYADPDVFFANSFPTNDLRALLARHPGSRTRPDSGLMDWPELLGEVAEILNSKRVTARVYVGGAGGEDVGMAFRYVGTELNRLEQPGMITPQPPAHTHDLRRFYQTDHTHIARTTRWKGSEDAPQ
ncbi:MAG: hypothetical protein KTV45_13095 [Acidimicrobiia bacterium]|nr:hypothetical protein [Acidimicrobiia bacterium]